MSHNVENDARKILRALYDQRPSLGCPTEGCKGDPRYVPPGRGHLPTCTEGHVLPPGPCPDTGMPVESCLCMTHDPDGAHFRTTRDIPPGVDQ